MRAYHVESLPNYYLERINPLGYKPEYTNSTSEKTGGSYQLFLNRSDQSTPLTPPSNVSKIPPSMGDSTITTAMILDLVNGKHTTPRRSRPFLEERKEHNDTLGERKVRFYKSVESI
jgi:hypothetical protein